MTEQDLLIDAYVGALRANMRLGYGIALYLCTFAAPLTELMSAPIRAQKRARIAEAIDHIEVTWQGGHQVIHLKRRSP